MSIADEQLLKVVIKIYSHLYTDIDYKPIPIEQYDDDIGLSDEDI